MGVLFTDKVSCNSNLRYTHQTHFSVMVCVNWQEEVKKQYLKDLTLGIIRKKLWERIFRFLDQILASIEHCKIIQELMKLKWDSQDEL